MYYKWFGVTLVWRRKTHRRISNLEVWQTLVERKGLTQHLSIWQNVHLLLQLPTILLLFTTDTIFLLVWNLKNKKLGSYHEQKTKRTTITFFLNSEHKKYKYYIKKILSIPPLLPLPPKPLSPFSLPFCVPLPSSRVCLLSGELSILTTNSQHGGSQSSRCENTTKWRIGPRF